MFFVEILFALVVVSYSSLITHAMIIVDRNEMREAKKHIYKAVSPSEGFMAEKIVQLRAVRNQEKERKKKEEKNQRNQQQKQEADKQKQSKKKHGKSKK